MSLIDSLRVALTALVANRLRAALTMLGIVIGVGSVISLMAVGQGSQQAVSDRIAGLGSNLLFIQPGSTSQGGLQGGIGSAQTLSSEDANAIISDVPNVVDAVSELQVGGQLSASGTNTFARVIGVSADYANVLSFKLTEGEFFNSVDVDQSKAAVVLGSNLVQTLFPEGDPIGQTLRLGVGRNNFLSLEVVGILASVGGTGSTSRDNLIYVPFTLAQRRISSQFGARSASLVSQITVQLRDREDVSAAKQAISDLLLSRHSVSSADFVIQSQDDIAATANEVNRTMTVLLGAIAGISLFVGGIGIMNIMLVSVTERTHEIGIRKAVGARDSDILMQFLTEALAVTLLGGLLGVGAGITTAQFLDGKDIAGLGNNIRTVISWTSVAAAIVVAGVIGVFFGLYPAERAARLNPIDALRYE
jgi:putative ABC transport system permease protein